jgi:hypothetical protein
LRGHGSLAIGHVTVLANEITIGTINVVIEIHGRLFCKTTVQAIDERYLLVKA